MAFVMFHGDAGSAAWRTLSFAHGYACTVLAGKQGRPVLALPDPALDELAASGIAFTTLAEAELPQHLTPPVLAYYRHLRQRQPDHLDFTAALPPALHVVLTCTVPEPHVEAVREIVQRYEPARFHSTDVSLHAVPADPEQSIDVQPMVRLEFTVPRARHEALIDELLASGAAGTDQATAIHVLSDPDGPPRAASQGPRGH